MKRLKLAVVGNSNGNNQTVDNKKVSSDILKIWKLSKEMNIA